MPARAEKRCKTHDREGATTAARASDKVAATAALLPPSKRSKHDVAVAVVTEESEGESDDESSSSSSGGSSGKQSDGESLSDDSDDDDSSSGSDGSSSGSDDDDDDDDEDAVGLMPTQLWDKLVKPATGAASTAREHSSKAKSASSDGTGKPSASSSAVMPTVAAPKRAAKPSAQRTDAARVVGPDGRELPRCRVCSATFDDVSELLAHRETPEHKKAATAEQRATYCRLCKKQFTSKDQKTEHEKGKWHQMRLARL